MSRAAWMAPRCSMIGRSRKQRTTSTVRGEKLGAACASHSLPSASSEPCAENLGVSRSASRTSAASARAASRLAPWKVRAR